MITNNANKVKLEIGIKVALPLKFSQINAPIMDVYKSMAKIFRVSEEDFIKSYFGAFHKSDYLVVKEIKENIITLVLPNDAKQKKYKWLIDDLVEFRFCKELHSEISKSDEIVNNAYNEDVDKMITIIEDANFDLVKQENKLITQHRLS